MRRTDAYFNTLDYLETKTSKVLLTAKDVGLLLNISQPTVRKHFGRLFNQGYISLPVLAGELSKKGN